MSASRSVVGVEAMAVGKARVGAAVPFAAEANSRVGAGIQAAKGLGSGSVQCSCFVPIVRRDAPRRLIEPNSQNEVPASRSEGMS
jgi:hypothetical protein